MAIDKNDINLSFKIISTTNFNTKQPLKDFIFSKNYFLQWRMQLQQAATKVT